MEGAPLDFVAVAPRSIRGFGSFFNLVERRLEYHPNVQLRVSFDYGKHLAPIFRSELTLGFKDDP